MKKAILLFITIFFSQAIVGTANFSGSPDLVKTAATYAKIKAKINTTHSTVDEATDIDDQNGAIRGHTNSPADSSSCDLNVANVFIDDDVRSPPDEVIIVIEGDIIQANDCR